jgi:hypothetical protein
MGNPTTDQAYARFLRSSDVASWVESMRVFCPPGGGGEAEGDPEDVTRALIVTLYARWLGALCGQSEVVREAKANYASLSTRLLQAYRSEPARASRMGLGVLLAMSRYSVLGATYATPDELARPEVALLFEPSAAEDAAEALGKVVAASGREPFRPLLHSYGNALLRLGALTEARATAARFRTGGDGMLEDIQGQIHEQAGEWQEARDVYARSPWRAHQYRAALCASIRDGVAGVAGDLGARDRGGDVSRREMARFAPEIDQAEIARSMAFIEACRWVAFDDWLIRFELGKLAFRRRRHGEAEWSLRQASEDAPPGRRYPILSLRFSNLTWLAGEYHDRALPMIPEAIRVARDALRCAADPSESVDPDDESDIRLWIAGETGELDLLGPVLERGSHYNRGRAHALRGAVAGAVDCWLAAVHEGYYHRALLPLIAHLWACELFTSAELLARVIEHESRADFFALLELGQGLLASLEAGAGGAHGGARVQAALARVADRIHELCRSNYQNPMRAHELFLDIGDRHIAESLLNRAEQLADGAEERLAIAIARRQARPVQETDPRIVATLIQAERESRDRLERLQIAREYYYCGQQGRARRILREEGIVGERRSSHIRLGHVELAVVLWCARWLERDDVERLGMEAIEALERDVDAGRHPKEIDKLFEHLRFSLFLASEPLYLLRFQPALETLQARWREVRARDAPPDTGADDEEPGDLGSGPAPGRQDLVSTLVTAPKDDASVREALSKVAREAEAATLGELLALWKLVRDRIDDHRARAVLVRPDVPEASTPMVESTTMIDSRTQELCDLWRRVLARQEGPAALEKFFENEEQLARAWEDSRRAQRARLTREAEPWHDCAERLVATLRRRAGETLGQHPYWDGFYQAIAEDARWLEERLPALRGSFEGASPQQPLAVEMAS